MPVRAIDDKASDTLVVVSDEGFWTGSSTLPHLHHFFLFTAYAAAARTPVTFSVERPRAIISPAPSKHSTALPAIAIGTPTVTDRKPISGGEMGDPTTTKPTRHTPTRTTER